MENFHSIQQFFHMSGYGWYVWPAYIVFLMVLIANVIHAQCQLSFVIKNLKKRFGFHS